MSSNSNLSLSHEAWSACAEVPIRFGVRGRIKTAKNIQSTPWATWIIVPTKGYIELEGLGPILARDVVNLEFESISEERIGRYVPAKKIDKTREITDFLTDQKIRWQEIAGIIRIQGN